MTAQPSPAPHPHALGCEGLRAHVLAPDLCCGCGACAGACPSGAVRMDTARSHQPALDPNRCTDCGLCLDVCPGRGYPVRRWATQRADADSTPLLPARGPTRRRIAGHALDPDLRSASASGGVATALLLHLLETGRVDDVAVVGMEGERPAARLTHDPDVVRAALMSKYGPVPLLATVIPELLRRPRRVALTVTPCQLGGLRLALDRLPKLRRSDIFTLGLFCGQVQSYDALTAIAASLGIRYPGDAAFRAWRAGPYPGSARFERPDGTTADKPLYQWLDIAVPFFSLRRCFLCPDGANWLADMSLGDIHAGGTDETVIVSRTPTADDALNAAADAGAIALRDLTPEQVDACVIRAITRSKLLQALARNRWLAARGRPAPKFDYDASALLAPESPLLAHLWVWRYRLTFWARTGWRRRVLLRRPRLLQRVGHFLYYFPATLPGWRAALRIRTLMRRR